MEMNENADEWENTEEGNKLKAMFTLDCYRIKQNTTDQECTNRVKQIYRHY
jgi:hypothetical protein